jgi:primosomal protein N' (replication factor Y)
MNPPSTIPVTYVSVAIPAPLYGTYDYAVDEQSAKYDLKGKRALVRFGNRSVIGIITEQKSRPDFDPEKISSVQYLFDEPKVFDELLFQLIKWASTYYAHPIGECFSAALPPALKKPKLSPIYETTRWQRSDKPYAGRKNAHRLIALLDIIEQSKHGIWEDTLKSMGFKTTSLKRLHKEGYLERHTEPMASSAMQVREDQIEYQLNEGQQKALKALQHKRGFNPCLLEGVTGSGKTEVYIALARNIVARGQQALVLVPEINLTPQTFRRFQSQLGMPVAVYHSGMSEKEKQITYALVHSGEARIVIGTRSAIFLPFETLGLIVVDEEHDASYKQMDGFKYSARDLAVKRAQLHECSVVLGSATPSGETLANALAGRFDWHKLDQRANSANLPKVSLEDMRALKKHEHFAPRTLQAIKSSLDAGDQVIIFQNRRGFAPSLMCFDCGWLCSCPSCDARLTVHMSPKHLHCHHCDYKSRLPDTCQNCNSGNLQPVGAGTERLEQTLNYYFPNTTCLRMDRDQIKSQGSLDKILEEIQSGAPAIIVGTQMLAKGHDFPNVTLVVVVDADGLFFSSDYRALERGAQQLLQVAGRTGRGEKPGRVIIQTRQPEQTLFEHICTHNYRAFLESELDTRKACYLPPFSKMLSIRAEAKTETQASETLSKIKESLDLSSDSKIFAAGPMPAAITRKQNTYRYLLHIFCATPADRAMIQQKILGSLSTITPSRQVKLSIDVDPLEFI